MNASIEGSNPSFSVSAFAGGVAERSNAAVSKTVSGRKVRRGFKSLPLRFFAQPRAAPRPERRRYECIGVRKSPPIDVGAGERVANGPGGFLSLMGRRGWR